VNSWLISRSKAASAAEEAAEHDEERDRDQQAASHGKGPRRQADEPPIAARRPLEPLRRGDDAEDPDPGPADHQQAQLHDPDRRPAGHGLAGDRRHRRSEQAPGGSDVEDEERRIRPDRDRQADGHRRRRKPQVERIDSLIRGPQDERRPEQERGQDRDVDAEQAAEQERLGDQADPRGQGEDPEGDGSGHAGSRWWVAPDGASALAAAVAAGRTRGTGRLPSGDDPAAPAVARDLVGRPRPDRVSKCMAR
jgi:hypothetical protein